jgi:hypothetical protein
MNLTNAQIYNYVLGMNQAFEGFNEPLPAKLNFYINKNQQTLFSLAQVIERTRDDIAKTEQNEELRNYKLQELSDITQEVDIKMIPLSWITNDLRFTQQQMLSIMWMIDDKEETENGQQTNDAEHSTSTDDN